MKRIFLFICLVSVVDSLAQAGDTLKKGRDIKKMVFTDSALQKLQKFKDSVANSIQIQDASQIQENISRNTENILQFQKEQRDKKKKAAITRIGIGVALLVVLIIGLRRRKK